MVIKDLSRAKSRMTALAPAHRGRLAALMAVTVARACAEVVDQLVVVTTAPGIGPLLAAYGPAVRVVADPRSGMNAAINAGAAALLVDGCEFIVATVADLPALTATDLADTLTGCVGTGRWFVRDDVGTGTTLLAARGVPLSPLFGPDSATRHADSGAQELAVAAGLRLDADQPDDLLRAIPLGLDEPVASLIADGQLAEHTTGTVVGPGWSGLKARGPGVSGPETGAVGTVGPDQEGSTGMGAGGDGWEVVLAAGTRAYAPASALGREFRSLAAGQRVHLVRDAAGGIRHLWI